MSSRPELKVDDELGFIKFFKNLPQRDGETIRVFDRGDYYTAHGDDASFIARTVYKTTSVLRDLGSNSTKIPSVTMTITVYKNFLREALYRMGKRVEILTTSGKNNWKVTKTASPGNLQDVEEELGGSFDAAPIILAVKVSAKVSEARNIGVCFADASVRELGVSEFLDNDLYSNFESLLIQLGVKECLIQVDRTTKDVELAKLKQIIESCGCAWTERAGGTFGTKDIEQDLARLLKDEKSAGVLPQTDLKLAMGSAAALINYLGVLHDSSNFGQYQLYQHDLSQFMKLDAAALKALNLMPGPRDGSKTMSLYGLLNHCKTPVGSRLLAQWLKQPLMSLEEIEKRQQLVEAFVEDQELRQSIQEEHMKSIPDLYRLAKRFQKKLANLEDVVRAYQVVIRIPGFVDTLEAVMDEKYRHALDEAYTIKLRECSEHLGKLAELVETTVDLEAMDNHEYIIKPEFDPNLKTISRALEKLKYEMNQEFRVVAKDLGQEIEKKIFLENNKIHGWCMRLTRTEASCIRNKSKYQECQTLKSGVFFTTSKLLSIRREFDQLSENYNRTQASLVSEVVGVAASYCPVIETLASILAHLDVIISLAHTSVHAPTSYIRPKMHPRGTGSTILKESRHPSRVGASDSQLKGVSTFMAEMLETANILKSATSESLIIIDELGRGTSTYDGFGLAWAISEYIVREIGAFGMFATHFHELTALVDSFPQVKNLHVVAHIDTDASSPDKKREVTLLYKVEEGICDQSFGIHVAELVKFPEKVISMARRKAEELEDFGSSGKGGERVDNGDPMSTAGSQEYGKEDVEEGSRLLKEVLKKWKAEVDGRGEMGKDEKISLLRELVGGDKRLLGNPFFKSIKTL
ncbi:hypothetical protein EYC84_009057 [Monilinia fructicola]|uniref:DNA mismatch repair proteins mutS family domain-containing protein n=1 Tax=Monilinia fructicola TaxID=38448 RepID=A0A5M9JA79_MONFR|nr:hypothetical protein EYC84_009057 [Monilinia fructicola]